MLRYGLRNLALLSGFAWHDGDRWLLRQREPIALGLPLILGNGIRAPEHREAIDVIGSLVMHEGGLVLEVAHLDRAARSSFPRSLKWSVAGVAPGEPLFPEWRLLKNWRTIGEGEINLDDQILSTLRERPSAPEDLVAPLMRDPAMAAWRDGTQRAKRLTNFVLMTGFVGAISQYADSFVTPYYNMPLQVQAVPAPPIPARLTQDVIALPGVRGRLRSYSPIPTTVTGEFMAKVRPNDDGSIRELTHYVRVANVVETLPEDFSGLPSWLAAWRDSRPRASARAAATAAA